RTSHDQCPVPSVPAAELERLVLDRIRGILKSPDVVAGAIRHVRSEDNECSESEVIDLLMRLDPVWEELFPLEQNRLLKLLVENVSVTNHGVDIRLPLLAQLRRFQPVFGLKKPKTAKNFRFSFCIHCKINALKIAAPPVVP
ncbi:MAG: hypothetical protein HOL70_06020, partial [Candidatus Marinimicrobia bacterium]|nr:hypothetical protein [Candidatus Neomarinimicrobiota bacterium]